MSFSLKALVLSFALFQIVRPSGDNSAMDAVVRRLSTAARKPAAKATRIKLPPALLKEVQADPEDCLDDSPRENARFDAYRIPSTGKRGAIVLVHARNSCYCGVTGNCEFWIFNKSGNTYKQILQMGMVRDFGFLPTRTNGLRDFIAWEHGSAQRTPGRLFRFDGKTYNSVCAWEEVYSFDQPGATSWNPVMTGTDYNSCTDSNLRGK